MTNTTVTTKHATTCTAAFGRKDANCPRCVELINGAAPVAQTWRNRRYNRPTTVHRCDSNCPRICVTADW